MTGNPTYITRYVYADTILSTHGGSAGSVRITSEEHSRLRQMAEHLERCCNDLDAAGYEVISIAPIVSGRTAYMETNSQRDYPGHGYSVTDGLIVTGRLKGQSTSSIVSDAISGTMDTGAGEPYRQHGLELSHYRQQSRAQLAHSRRLLARGKLAHAAEYGWAAAVWMVKGVAEAQGWTYGQQDEIKDVMHRASLKSGNDQLLELNRVVGLLLTFSGARKRFLDALDVGCQLDQVAVLLDILEPLTETEQR